MGKRRYGFLTEWQWDYIRRKVKKRSSGKALTARDRRSEDYHIMKSWEIALKQMEDFAVWANEPSFLDVVRNFYRKGRPRTKTGTWRFKQKVTCPKCGLEFDAELYVDKLKRVVVQSSQYGITKGKLSVTDSP